MARQSVGIAESGGPLPTTWDAAGGAGAGAVRARLPAFDLDLLHDAEIRLGTRRCCLVAGGNRHIDRVLVRGTAQACGSTHWRTRRSLSGLRVRNRLVSGLCALGQGLVVLRLDDSL